MIEQLAEALKPLLLECAEEQLDTMAETVAKELLSRADNKGSFKLVFDLRRSPRSLDVKACLKFSTPFSSTASEASADIDFDQEKMDL